MELSAYELKCESQSIPLLRNYEVGVLTAKWLFMIEIAQKKEMTKIWDETRENFR